MQKKKLGRIIAIDYGQKRVGVAVTDELQMIATALNTIPSSTVFSFLKKYLDENVVDCIVVGLPLTLQNNPSESSRFIEPFVKQLIKNFPTIKVERIDERFTSKMASAAIMESGAKKKDRRDKSLIDKVSAVIMLQSYLEMLDFRK